MNNPAGRETEQVSGIQTEEVVIPVVAEQIKVDTVAVPRGGVRVIRRSVSEQQPITASLHESRADVRRVAINQVVDGPLPMRQTENGIVIPIVEEELVVQRRWILREEVYVEQKESVSEYHDSVIVTHDEVVVERLEP